MAVIFAHTRAEYASYVDYIKLVRLAGFKTCYVDEISLTSGHTYVVTPVNGEYRPCIDGQRDKDHNSRLVWWSLERPGRANGMMGFRKGVVSELLDGWYFDEIWMADKFLVDQLCDERVRFVILGSHERLGTLKREGSKYHFALMAYRNGRRGRIMAKFDRVDIKLTPNAWGKERDALLKQSQFMLNIHQDDWQLIEPLRFALCSAYGLPMLSERIADAYPYTRQGDGHTIVQADEEDLVGVARNMLSKDYMWWRAMGRRLHFMMTQEYSFQKMVRLAYENEPMPVSMELV